MSKRTIQVSRPMIENKNVTLERLQEGKQVVQPLLLNIEQAMRVLSLGKTKIYELIESEGLPVIHIGKAVRFPYTRLQQWIDERMQQDIA